MSQEKLLINDIKSNNSEIKRNSGDCKNCNSHEIEEMARELCPLAVDKECKDCVFEKRNINCNPKTYAKRSINAGYRKQEWISVEDRLPEEKVNCLIHYKHAYCDNDGYWNIGVSFYDGHEFHIGLEYKVTHWMPLPEAPKMKNTEN